MVAPLLIVLALMLALALVSLESLSTLRAYASAANGYFKGQRDAIALLAHYVTTRDSADSASATAALSVPLADAQARNALDANPADLETARTALIEARIDPADIPSMILFYRCCGAMAPLRNTVDIAGRAAQLSERIALLGGALRQAQADAALAATDQEAALVALRAMSGESNLLEGQFAQALGEFARRVRNGLAAALTLAVLIMAYFAVGVARARARERATYQGALGASEQRYRSVFESSLDAVLITEPDGRVVDANPEACRLFGYSPQEIRGLGRSAVVDDRSDAPGLELALRQRAGRFKSHLKFRRKDGRTFTGEASLTSFTDRNDSTLISTVIRDITGQQRYERGLARLAALYAAQSQTSQLIVRVSEQAQLFEELCRICVAGGGLDLAAVGLLEGGSRNLRFVAAHGNASRWLDTLAVSAEGVLASDLESASAALVAGEPQVRNDIEFVLGSLAADSAEAGGLFRSGASFPLRCRGKTIGVLSVFSAEAHFFDRDIIDLMRQIAGEISFALDNLNREEERQHREALLADQNRILSLVASGAELNVVLKTLAHLIESQSADTVCSVVVLDQQGAQYSTGAAPSLSESYESAVVRVTLDGAAGPCAEAIRSRAAVVIEDLATYPLDPPLLEFVRAAGLHSARAWPIINARDQVIGALALYGRAPGRLAALDEAVVHIGIDLAGIAIENRTAAERIQHLAHHDELTGLPNRILYGQYLTRALARAKRNKTRLGVLFLDLDRFKNINDTLGHGAGDKALSEIANRLRSGMRESDILARVGGDEFTALIEGFANPQVLADVAQKILSITARTLVVNGQECTISGSIGIALYPDDGNDMAALLKNADIAMYRAKNAGRDNFQFYSEEMNEHSLERLALESQLRHAISRREFEIHYQPKVDLKSGRASGAEALVRWRHPERGLLAPAEFIAVAEDVGLIGPIGRLVIEAVCNDARRWANAGVVPFRIAINLSAHQCDDPRLLTDLDRVLADTGIETVWLEFEITESVVMHSIDKALRLLGEIKRRGITLAIDDFGTGHSSLAYLKRFPVDTLKIDRTFVRDLSVDQNDLAITRAIIAMGHSLGLKVIAEGVETAAQLEIMRRFECDEYQGYLFSKALPVAEFEVLMGMVTAPQPDFASRRA